MLSRSKLTWNEKLKTNCFMMTLMKTKTNINICSWYSFSYNINRSIYIQSLKLKSIRVNSFLSMIANWKPILEKKMLPQRASSTVSYSSCRTCILGQVIAKSIFIWAKFLYRLIKPISKVSGIMIHWHEKSLEILSKMEISLLYH